MHESEFNEIFGVDNQAVITAINNDDEGWLESDYQEAYHVLNKLKNDNPEQYEDFTNRFRSVVGLEKFSLQERCRIIYLLLTCYIDWPSSKLTRLRNEDKSIDTVYFIEKINTKSPKIRFNFQNLFDQIHNFNPPSQQLDELASIFSPNQNIHQTEDEHFPEIVRGMGKKLKPGRKRQIE